MKISIITVTFNSEGTIEETIKSVINQTYKNIEYIIVDGCSTDDTKFIINKYIKQIDKFICEKDESLWEAMNKGVAAATGNYIGFLNSDDKFIDEHVIKKIHNAIVAQNADISFGYLDIVNRFDLDQIVRKYRIKHYNKNSLRFGLMPAHPTFYCKRELFEEYGAFQLRNDIAPDFELMIRFLLRANIKKTFIPEVLIKMRNGGVGNSKLKYKLTRIKRQVKSCRINGLWTNEIFMLLKYFYKIFECSKTLRLMFFIILSTPLFNQICIIFSGCLRV